MSVELCHFTIIYQLQYIKKESFYIMQSMKTFWTNFQLIRVFSYREPSFFIIKNRKPVKLKLINLWKWYSMNFQILNWFKIVSTQFYMNECWKHKKGAFISYLTFIQSSWNLISILCKPSGQIGNYTPILKIHLIKNCWNI